MREEAYQCTDEQADAAMCAATQERLDVATMIATIDTPEPLLAELKLLTQWLQGPTSRLELRQIHERAGVLVEALTHAGVPRMAVAS